MDGRIAHHHCHFTEIGDRAVAGVTTRLERLARDEVAQTLTESLTLALGDDPTIYVLRGATATLVVNAGADESDASIVRRWGASLAGAIVRAVATGSEDGQRLVRFDDQAAFVASFIRDLLRGTAWRQWWYHPFAGLRDQPPAAILRAVLLEHRAHLPGVLRNLRREGTLDELLRVLDTATLRELWQAGHDTAVLDPTTARPLFAATIRLAERLGLLMRPSPMDELSSYLATSPQLPDWRDARSLAGAIIEALAFLVRAGYIRQIQEREVAAFMAQLDTVLPELDWVDIAWLRPRLIAALVSDLQAGVQSPDLLTPTLEADSSGADSPAADYPGADLPTASAPASSLPDHSLPGIGSGPVVSPRLRELLVDIQAVLRTGIALDAAAPAGPANALRIFAALVTHAPRWSDDPVAPGILQHLLETWAAVIAVHAPDEFLRLLRQGATEEAVLLVHGEWRDDSSRSCVVVARLGDPALVCIELLVNAEWTTFPTSAAANETRTASAEAAWFVQSSRAADRSLRIETACAGLFLLLRPIMDMGLPRLVRQIDYPAAELPNPLSTLLAGLGLRLAAPLAAGDRIDPGLALFAGDETQSSLAAWQAAWSDIEPEKHAQWQRALFDVLAGQRLAGGSILHVWRLPKLPLANGATTLVAGGEPAGLWPFGRAVGGNDSPYRIVVGWVEDWEAVTGQRPVLAVPADLEIDFELLARATGTDILLITADQLPEDAAAAAHMEQQQALQAALVALDEGRTGHPAADLTLTLTANTLLRIWARWLRQFADSSASYLLTNFVRRPGVIRVTPQAVFVDLEPGPLDVVLTIAGYSEEIERVPWLGNRSVRFAL